MRFNFTSPVLVLVFLFSVLDSANSFSTKLGGRPLRQVSYRTNLRATDYSEVGRLQRIPIPLKRRLNSLLLKQKRKQVENAEISTKTDTDKSLTLPSYRKLIVFTATTILIWISEPLLSLVDTTIVGMTTSAKSAVVQIAALGPATTLYDSAIYMTYFLAIATTNQLAPSLAKKDWKGLRESTSHLMGLAVLFGTIVMAFTFAFGRQIIGGMVGPLTNSEIIPLATNYAWIRAAVAPFCVVDFVAQSICLATLDTITPAVAVAVASVVNVVGDLLLSPRWGIQGAAAATAMATVSSSLILVRKVRKNTQKWKEMQLEEENSSGATPNTRVVDGKIDLLPSSTILDDESDSNEPTRDNNEHVTVPSDRDDIPFWSLPDKTSLLDLTKLGGPIFFIMMAKIACYSIMTVRATNFGIIPLASHNIMMRVFFFFACFGDSLSQAGQTFIPQVSKANRGRLVKRLFYISSIVGLGISQLSSGILTNLGVYLTKDASIISLMAEYAKYVGFATLLHPFIMFLEGVIFAKRDLMFLVGMYICTTILHFGFVFSPIAGSFAGLWRAMFVFQAIRLVQLGGRIWSNARKRRTKPSAVSMTP